MRKICSILIVITALANISYAASGRADEIRYGKAYAKNIVPGIIEAENFNDGKNGVAY